ncbi:hypothetical protein KUCAC02_006974, partial [Chaenocephalus aceratus]
YPSALWGKAFTVRQQKVSVPIRPSIRLSLVQSSCRLTLPLTTAYKTTVVCDGLPPSVALSGFRSEHGDTRLKRAERDQRDTINFSPLDPVTPGAQRESRRESQLSAPRLGRFEVGSGE